MTTISVLVDAEMKRIDRTSSGGGTSGDPVFVNRGETITFSKYGSGSVTLSNFDLGFWTNTSNVTVSSTVTKQVSSSAPTNDTRALVFSKSGYTSETVYYRIDVPPPDNIPSSFTLANVGDATRSTTYSVQYTVTGLSTGLSVTAGVSGNGAKISRNGDTPSTANRSVTNYDNITVTMNSSGSYAAQVTTNVTVGGSTKSWSISTATDLNTYKHIYLGVNSGTILHQQLIDFYKAPTSSNTLLKGGTYVPNISANSRIPTSFPLDFQDYYYCANVVYFKKVPQSYSRMTNTQGGGTWNQNFTWVRGNEWTIGYGPNMEDRFEYKFVVSDIRYSNAPDNSAISYASNTSHGTYSTANAYFQVAVSRTGFFEAFYRGNITMYARSIDTPSVVLTTTFSYAFSFYGP